jgi:hypothetical protein
MVDVDIFAGTMFYAYHSLEVRVVSYVLYFWRGIVIYYSAL